MSVVAGAVISANTFAQIARVAVVFAAAAGALAFAVQVTDSDTTLQQAAFGVASFRAMAVGAGFGVVWGPLVGLAPRNPVEGAALGGLIALVSLGIGVGLYFWMWPPEWRPAGGALAVTKLFFGVYGARAVPLALVGGLSVGLWTGRVNRAARSPEG